MQPPNTEKAWRRSGIVREARRIIAGTLKAAGKGNSFYLRRLRIQQYGLIGTALANQRAGRHIISTAVEHPSVYNPLTYLEELGFEITFLPVDHNGHISLQQLGEAIRPDTDSGVCDVCK